MEGEPVVSVELTKGEVALIQYFIEERHQIFGFGGIPARFGETKVGQKMMEANLLFSAQAKATDGPTKA